MEFISQIKMELRELDLRDEKLRSFGVLMASVFALLVVWSNWRAWAETAIWIFLALGIFFALVTMFFPRVLSVPYRLWMGLALVLGSLISPVILGVLFFLVLTPISLLKKLIHRKKAQKSDSYWIDSQHSQDTNNMERLF